MNDAEADPAIQRLEIDGVPVFWLPGSRRSVAALQFRVGRSDEPFTTMGITHIVEHLAFFKLGKTKYGSNGFVDNIRTVFHASGEPADLGAFLHGIIAALRELPLERLADESRILRTEARNRQASIWDTLAWYRYGAAGQGSAALPEFGLGTVSSDAVARWSAEWFTAGNAIVWIGGPLPDGLRLDLPAGPRRPVPAAVPIADLPLPAWAPTRIPGIAMGLAVRRESAAAMANRILTRRLEHHLRYELGRSYEVSLAYQPLDGVDGHASLFASCLDDDAAKVRAAFLATVDQFTHGGPTDEELADDCDGFARHMADPDAGLGTVERAASSELIGHRPDTPAELLAEMHSVRSADVRDAMASAMDRAILIGPVDDTPTGLSARQWRTYPAWSFSAVAGTRYEPASRKYPWQPRTQQLIVGPEGVSWLNRLAQPVSVLFKDVVGLVIDPEGARVVYGRDGFRVVVRASEWKNGARAVAAVDAAVPPDLVVRLAPL